MRQGNPAGIARSRGVLRRLIAKGTLKTAKPLGTTWFHEAQLSPIENSAAIEYVENQLKRREYSDAVTTWSRQLGSRAGGFPVSNNLVNQWWI